MPVCRLNRWSCLAGAGLLGATGYGITEISYANTINSQSLKSKEYIDLRTNELDSSPHQFNEFIIPLSSTSEDEMDLGEGMGLSDLSSSNQLVIQDSKIITSPSAEVSYSDYTEDAKYVSNLWSTSMGWKFKNHVILSPKGSKIWEYKAQKIKERATKTRFGDKTKGLWRYKNWLYNAWNRENIDMHKMDGNKIHSLCTDILSYNDYGIWFTYISRLNYKWFFDFVWEVCGREDRTKPSNWKYAQ